MLYIFITLLCSLMWAGIIIATKLLTTQIPPLAFTLIRYSLVSSALLPFFLYRKEYQHLEIRAIPGLLLLGFFLVIVYTTLFFSALSFTTATSVALITATSPVCILAFAALLGQTTLTRLQSVAILVCFMGIGLVVTQGKIFLHHWHTYTGELLALGAVFCQVLYSSALRKVSMHYSTLFVTFSTALAGILFAVPLVAGKEFVELIMNLTIAQWALLACISIGGGILSIFLHASALKHQGISHTNLIIFPVLQLSTALLAHLMLGEVISIWQVGGGICIGFSILLSCTPRNSLFFAEHEQHLTH